MTVVLGQIESLKSIKEELSQNGISRFSSVGEINTFIDNYDFEIQTISKSVEHEFENELVSLETDLRKFQDEYENLKAIEKHSLNNEIADLKARHTKLKSRKGNVVVKAIDYIELMIIRTTLSRLEKKFDKIISKRTNKAEQLVQKTKKRLLENTINREKVLSNRISLKTKDLTHTKEVVDSLYPLIAGAVGENLVVKELNKLSDKYTLFNDFSIRFKKPIFNKKKNERIYSIQIDHLLVSNAGVFVIETKNWSKESIKNYDLRSPIEQIRRTSYALFVLLNSKSNQQYILSGHHWGQMQIPIRNLVVMINHRPKEKFKHVAVKTLKEMNRYVNYFEPVFNDSDVEGIVRYLGTLTEQNDLSVQVKQKPQTTRKKRERGKNKDNSFQISGQPTLQNWLKSNPGKGVNDYYSRFYN